MEKLRSNLFFILCLLLIAGLFLIDVIRILPSLSMAGLVVLGIFYWLQKQGLNQDKSKIPYYLLTLCFWILLPSYFYSSNTNYWMQKIQIAIPFLLLPLAFIKIPALSRIRYLQVLAFFVGGTFLISGYAFLNYLANQSVINQMYLESKVMPTLVSHHPTYSLMNVFAIYLCYYLLQEKETIIFKKEKPVLLFVGAFLFIFVHVFSVRSGLLSLYILIGLEILKLIFQKKQIKLAIYIGISLLSIGLATLYLSPTVSNKITNTSKDLQSMNSKGSANNQSLSSRIISYQNALQINQSTNIWLGCGLGDIEDLNLQIFAEKHPDVSKPIIPHNQFLYYLAAIGVIGLILFIIGFFGPLLIQKAYKNTILSTHLLLSFLYFLVESPLVTQIGVAYVLSFYLLAIHQHLSEPTSSE
jgi:O-antigen ligase